MRVTRLAGALLWSLVSVSAAHAQTPTPADLELLLAGEPTPGSVALLVEHAGRPEALARLDASLRHARPDVRAAAARVAFVVGARGLLPTMASVLATETNAAPAAEMTRALATFTNGPADDVFFESWARLGKGQAARAAVAFAAARGPVALDAIVRLREIDDSSASLTAFILATNPAPPQLLALVDRALLAGDGVVFGTALAVARDRKVEVPDAVLARALEPARPPAVRRHAARYALGRPGDVPMPSGLSAAMAAPAPFAADATDPEALVLREFISRLTGHPANASRDWLARFDDPDAALAGVVQLRSVRPLLTDRERRQLGRTLGEFSAGARPMPTPAPPGPGPGVHLLDTYPAGFVPDLMAQTGCNLDKAKSQGLGAGAAQLALHPDGRVARVSLMNTGVSQPGCAQALRVLFMTHVVRQRPASGEEWIAVAPFDPEYLACRESQAFDTMGRTIETRGLIAPPKKTRHLNPVYPQTAINAGVQGLVMLEATIGTRGCVGDLQVTSSVEPRLDLSALLSVIGWRFSPTTVDGVAVPVVMTVTVQFSLR